MPEKTRRSAWLRRKETRQEGSPCKTWITANKQFTRDIDDRQRQPRPSKTLAQTHTALVRASQTAGGTSISDPDAAHWRSGRRGRRRLHPPDRTLRHSSLSQQPTSMAPLPCPGARLFAHGLSSLPVLSPC